MISAFVVVASNLKSNPREARTYPIVKTMVLPKGFGLGRDHCHQYMRGGTNIEMRARCSIWLVM